MHRLMTERVLKTIRNYDMWKAGDVILVGVSGGPDSVFLLHALKTLRSKLGIKEIIACNLDHGLRGKESALDSAFVRDMARSMGIKFVYRKVNLRKAADKKLSTEEIAREARYKFFRQAAQDRNVNVIATGHTLDDQAETILMRLIKGSALKGIIGISPVRADGSLRIIRPLIEIEKREICGYLDDNKIPYRIDRTNLEPVYFRNIVRSEIVPFLERYNPRLKRSLFNLAEHLREDFQFIKDAKSNAGKMVSVSKEGRVEIRLKDILIQPRVIQKEILRDCLEAAGGMVKKLSFRHWKDIENVLLRKGTGKSLDLPGGIRVTRTTSHLIYERI